MNPKDERTVAKEKLMLRLITVGLEKEINGKKKDKLIALLVREDYLQRKLKLQEAQEAGYVKKRAKFCEMELSAIRWAGNHIVILEAEIKRLREEIANLKKGGGDK